MELLPQSFGDGVVRTVSALVPFVPWIERNSRSALNRMQDSALELPSREAFERQPILPIGAVEIARSVALVWGLVFLLGDQNAAAAVLIAGIYLAVGWVNASEALSIGDEADRRQKERMEQENLGRRLKNRSRWWGTGD